VRLLILEDQANTSCSLLTLEKVVSALTEDKPRCVASTQDDFRSRSLRAHIPYRDSKLTQILQPSLSGTAKVAVICTINPSRNSLEESKSTLKFATRVKKVVVAAERNEILDDKALLNKYRAQIAELQAELARKTAEAASIPPTPQRAPDDRRSSKMASLSGCF
jgi:centromeric protein E